MTERRTPNVVVTADGYYPSADGIEADFIVSLALGRDGAKGATVRLEYSRDGGETWDGRGVSETGRTHLHAFRVRTGPPVRVRVAVSGFKKQFAYWLEDRR